MRAATILTILTLCLAPLAAAAQDLYVAQTEEGYLNLRDGPGTRFDILRRLSPGDRVAIRETVGLWARVRLTSGQEGWVSQRYLEKGAPTVGARVVARTGEGYLNLRGGPGTTHPVLRRMYPGDRLDVIGQRGKWLLVRHVSGAEGWAYEAYTRR
ncbi:MAG: SH3 domain-containing protein [Jannaschia sp.]